MNKVLLIGRLVKKPELRYTESNKPVANFNLAVNRKYHNQAGEIETDFFNIVVWNKNAENCDQYLDKGSQVSIEGNLQNRTYEDKDGNKRYVTEVIAEQIEFLGKPKREFEDLNIKTEEIKSDTLDLSIDDDDLPF